MVATRFMGTNISWFNDSTELKLLINVIEYVVFSYTKVFV